MWKEQFLKAILKYNGLVTYACDAIGISYLTYRKHFLNDPEFRGALLTANERMLDKSEKSLHKLVDEREPSAVYFHLKCKGKHRGYVERQEIGFGSDSPEQRIIVGGKEILF
jgi:hypothetical protein